MWLKAFSYKEKLLSESEFWILTVVADDFESPSEIIDRLLQQTQDWTPKAGTIYPILHRLAEVNLLDKIEDGGLSFRRSNEGRIFLSSIGKPLKVQVIETCNYYKQVLNNLADLEKMPARYDQILQSVAELANSFKKDTLLLINKVKEKTDQPFDVPITFHD